MNPAFAEAVVAGMLSGKEFPTVYGVTVIPNTVLIMKNDGAQGKAKWRHIDAAQLFREGATIRVLKYDVSIVMELFQCAHPGCNDSVHVLCTVALVWCVPS